MRRLQLVQCARAVPEVAMVIFASHIRVESLSLMRGTKQEEKSLIITCIGLGDENKLQLVI